MQNENSTGNWLANIFIKQREIIEAAETPFSKLAIFVLPILAPAVPAFMTGLHLFKLFLEMFTFSYADNVSLGMSAIISLVLELLGYVGAISFIKSLFDWIKKRQDEFLVPFVLNGIAYGFYLLAMFLINVQLGRYFGTSQIINNIIGLLSFITVPTSLLAANHLNSVSDDEREEKLRQEERSDKRERFLIKHGKTPTNVYQSTTAMTNANIQSQPQSQSKSTDWRKVRPTLSQSKIRVIAESDPNQTAKSYSVSYRTAYNWKLACMKELGMKVEK
jgi:hypothetical protein